MFVSIVIPTYNRAHILGRCIESVLQQDFRNNSYEVIVINDGSQDKTYQVARQYQTIPQFRYFCRHHRGISAARNLGIKNALGEVLMFLDDDCLAGPQWVEKYAKVFQDNEGIEIIQGPCVYPAGNNFFRECTNYLTQVADLQRVIKSDLLEGGMEAKYIGSGNFAILRSTIVSHDLFFDEDLTTREDEDYFRRVAKLKIRIAYIHNPVAHITPFNFVTEARRYFFYGRGESRLQRKWGEYTRLQYDISWRGLRERYRPINSIIMLVIFRLREFYWNLGFLYQKLRDQYLASQN